MGIGTGSLFAYPSDVRGAGFILFFADGNGRRYSSPIPYMGERAHSLPAAFDSHIAPIPKPRK